ncbi:MAG: sugar nucleotide-binding protein, partial [Acidobacteria bacterium]|nr:sugar nucleotide-binding protein [Acidobacteriota bacterium]
MPRTLLTGHLGQLATDFKSLLPPADLVLTEFEDLDLSRRDEVLAFVASVKPELIINCAAYNRVDEAESRP